MQVRRGETADPKSRKPARASRAPRARTPHIDDALQWVTARVPAGLVRQIEGLASRTGTTRSDAIRECLAIAVETILGREGITRALAESDIQLDDHGGVIGGLLALPLVSIDGRRGAAGGERLAQEDMVDA